MVLGASIRGWQLQTGGIEEDCQAACCLDHPLQRRVRVWLLQPHAQWASSNTQVHWGDGKVLKLKSSLLAQMDIILVSRTWKSQNLIPLLKKFFWSRTTKQQAAGGPRPTLRLGEGFCSGVDWKCRYRSAFLGYLGCPKSLCEALNEQWCSTPWERQRTKSHANFQILLWCVQLRCWVLLGTNEWATLIPLHRLNSGWCIGLL